MERTGKISSLTTLNLLIGATIIGVLGFLLVPKVSENRTGPRRRTGVGNQLKQIALAMHNYHDTYGHLPHAYWVDADGRHSHSWRIQLLPFLEQEEAFDQLQRESIRRSPEKLLELRRQVAPPFHDRENRSLPAEQTSFMLITGPGTLFEEGKDISFRDCTDGSSNTILAVEVKRSGVNWDEPIDLDIRTMVFGINTSDRYGLGSPMGKGATVALADGSVRFLSNETLESMLRAMITRAGGEQFDLP
jgi:Protein of unknown function (DUF1559)